MNRHVQLLAALLLIHAHAWGGETHHARSPENGIESWELRENGVFFSLTQMLPDQARAFFTARGFDQAAAEAYAQACVFQTVLRNESAATIATHPADWRAHAGKERLAPKLDKDWLPEWKKRGLPESARIAFRWAQFPAGQTFEPGDWNQGMTAFALPRRAGFDLVVQWRENGQIRKNILKGVKCAEDR